ncbi:type III pantothenate kinase [Pseudoscardovia suis]|uniref:Type III pantothenate kinase n=1 Tax=Pseudoscardovia suis TaxID=987063 RepID=A0A261F1M5_9BIFI|nr:type III pantothenate kinase [Pseudoscardovia suis]OZG53022.1 type III pantothenate kinase [Pseudoscardovia suis]PJJ68529.1 type III pantothenate kinase [Pseudoscardovia suis]
MIVAVDIGNTNIVLGFIEDDEIHGRYRISTKAPRTGDEYGLLLVQFLAMSGYKPEDVEGVIICSVVPQVMHSFRASIINFFNINPMIVGPGIKTGVNVRVDDPRTLGSDCIVNCVGAYYLYHGACLVIDMGTATTFNYIDEDANIRMAVIAPGMQTSAHALAGDTAQLPNVEIAEPATVMATNTVASIQAGLYYTALGGLEKTVEMCRQETGAPFTVVATGGFASLFKGKTDAIDVFDPDLIFRGMNLIYKRQMQRGRR